MKRFSAAEERDTKVKQEATLLKVEIPKRLEESAQDAVERTRWSEDLKSPLRSRTCPLSPRFKGVYRNILKVDTQFPLDNMPSMKDFAAFQVREKRRRL